MAIVLASTENMSYEDWLEHRKLGIGGSDASVVCGINKYKSPVELWMDKTGQLPPQEAGEAAYWGTQLESIVRDEFTKRTGIEVTKPTVILQSEEHPFMLANLDGTCEVLDVGTCIFEAKTASAYKAGEWEDTIPDEYQLQIQHYMAVTGYAGAYIAVLIGGNTFRWKFVERDECRIAHPRRWMARTQQKSFSLSVFPAASHNLKSSCPTPPLTFWRNTMKPVRSWRSSRRRSSKPKIF